MSSLSNSTNKNIIKYWFKNLENNRFRFKFCLTKILEIYSFSRHKTHKVYDNYLPKMPVIKHSNIENKMPVKPVVAVVIPAYIKNNFDKHSFYRLIDKLKMQTYHIKFVIVIDDNSPIKFNLPKDIIYYKLKHNSGPAKARNKGIELSLHHKADIICFTDVDCVPDTNWSNYIVEKLLEDKTAHIVSGNTKSLNTNWFDVYHEINGTLNGRKFKDQDLLLYGVTCNLAIIRKVAENLRFDEIFTIAAGEDIDFCFRAINKEFNIKYCVNALVYHDYDYKKYDFIDNLKSFIEQFSKYSKGEKILLDKNPSYYSFFNNTFEIPSF